MKKTIVLYFFMLISCISMRSEATLTEDERIMLRNFPEYLARFDEFRNAILNLQQMIEKLEQNQSSMQQIINQVKEEYQGKFNDLSFQITRLADEAIEQKIVDQKQEILDAVSQYFEKIKNVLREETKYMIEKDRDNLSEYYNKIEEKLKDINSLKQNQESLVEGIERTVYNKVSDDLFPRIDQIEDTNKKIQDSFSQKEKENKNIYEGILNMKDELKKEQEIIYNNILTIQDDLKQEKEHLNSWKEEIIKDQKDQKNEIKELVKNNTKDIEQVLEKIKKQDEIVVKLQDGFNEIVGNNIVLVANSPKTLEQSLNQAPQNKSFSSWLGYK